MGKKKMYWHLFRLKFRVIMADSDSANMVALSLRQPQHTHFRILFFSLFTTQTFFQFWFDWVPKTKKKRKIEQTKWLISNNGNNKWKEKESEQLKRVNNNKNNIESG